MSSLKFTSLMVSLTEAINPLRLSSSRSVRESIGRSDESGPASRIFARAVPSLRSWSFLDGSVS
ncbi:MAG: hypothetical protein ACK56F_22030, partial [bacterium]